VGGSATTPQTWHDGRDEEAAGSMLSGTHDPTGTGVPAMRWVFAVLAALPLAGATEAAAQHEPGWNDARALDLVAQARARRAVPRADSGLTSYRARATGYVYFYLDRRDSGERNLVRTDQLALDVFWAAPNRTKQHIVGMRDAASLPNNIRYHLDHLTVVQDEFGDIIRMGDGDEVRDVPHPAAPGSAARYDFRLADSLSIRLTGRPEPIRVYELQVRPKEFDAPAFVGSMFIDRESAAIVRMSFTFTPASYVDRRLDYIRISLDNGLWEDRYWLPHEQRLEIRRQVPELDFPTGGVIRGVLRIGDYRFNEEFTDLFFEGRPVVAFPDAALERFDFDQPLHAEVEREGLGTQAELEELRRTALALVGARRLSGLPGVRLRLSDASSFFRYDRAEGARFGAGVVWTPSTTSRLEAEAGYPLERERASVGVAGEIAIDPALTLRAELFHERLRDMAPPSGVSGVLNTMHAALAEIDYLDPYFASGGRLRLVRDAGGPWSLGGTVLVERQRTAHLAVSLPHESIVTVEDDSTSGFRPVRAIPEGTLGEISFTAARQPAAASARAWNTDFALTLGAWSGEVYLQPSARGEAEIALAERGDAALTVRSAVGVALGSAPPQRLYLIGGRGSIPGWEFRSFGGDRFWTAAVELARDVAGPWVRARLLAHAGWAGDGGTSLPADWDAEPTDGVRTSVGAGIGVVHDMLRADISRGLEGGEWQLLVAIHPRLRDFL
jgi:hypothetical protein